MTETQSDNYDELEQNNERTENEYRRFMKYLPMAIVVHNKGIIKYCNLYAVNLFGANDKSELIEKPIIDFIHPDYRTEILKRTQNVYGSDEYHGNLMRQKFITLKGDVIDVDVSAISVVYNNENSALVVINDITEQEKRKLDLLAAKEKAEENNKLKTQFLNNLSHEIRTPMNGILGFTQMLNEPDMTDETKDEIIQLITDCSHQFLHIVDNVMEISTLETKQVETTMGKVSISELFSGLLSVFGNKAQEKDIPIYVKNKLDSKEDIIYSDKRILNKILSNIISNAIAYTDKGFVEIGCQTKENNIEFYVKDTGVGIKPENHEMIFDRFVQEDKGLTRLYGGLGVGLSIAKKNAVLLGGEISLDSEKGAGSTFYVRIPIKPDYNKK